MEQNSLAGKIQTKVSKLLTVSLLSSLLPTLVVASLVTSAPLANASVVPIALETSTAIANADLVQLGTLASRSGSTTTSTKPLTKSSNASAPFTMTGTDGLTGQTYQYQTMQSYGVSRAQTLKESLDFTSTIISNGITAGGASANNPYGLSGPYTGGESTRVTNAITFADSKSISKTGVRLESEMGSIPNTNNANAYGSVFGPEIWSVPFVGAPGKSLSFDWAAANGEDDYEVYAFLVKISSATDASCTAASGASTYGLTNPTTTHSLLAYSRGTTQDWITNAVAIPSAGCYRFRFVSGTYDQTGGRVVGASLYVAATVIAGNTQTINFPQPNDYIRTSSDIVLSAGATTNAAADSATLTYFSEDDNICTVLSNGNITLKATGTCTITVSSGSTNNFAAAQPVTRAFAVRSTPAAPSGQGTGLIAGAAETCANLTATLGTWNDGGDTITATSYQWSISSTLNGTYTDISGATSSTYTVPTSDLNKYLKVTFSRTNSVGTGSETSAALLISSQGSSCSSSAASVGSSAPLFLVSWNPNSGSGYMFPQYGYVGGSINLYLNTYKRDGYAFTGWNSKADGSGKQFVDGAAFKAELRDELLYAQWKLITTKPSITWPTPIAIQEGTPLSATQLNALAGVPGTYTYAPAAPTVLPVGKHSLKVTFVPTDPKFEAVELTVEIEVLSRARVTWVNPASIVEGTALSATQLNATGSVPGTFTYAPATGTVLAVGRQTLRVTFTPTDTRLSAVTADVVIDVTAKPEIIAAPPVSPTYSVTGAPKTSIIWGAGENAVSYTVLVDGKSACAVAVLTCDVAQLLGPKNVVTVTSVAATGKTSAAVRATYAAPTSAQVLSVVNFDTARAVIKSTEAAKLRAFAAIVRAAGYTTLTVYGHTDSVGGVDNRKLSVSRANSTITFLRRVLPGVKFTVSGFAASTPVGDNSTTEGKAANRRAEVFIP